MKNTYTFFDFSYHVYIFSSGILWRILFYLRDVPMKFDQPQWAMSHLSFQTLRPLYTYCHCFPSQNIFPPVDHVKHVKYKYTTRFITQYDRETKDVPIVIKTTSFPCTLKCDDRNLKAKRSNGILPKFCQTPKRVNSKNPETTTWVAKKTQKLFVKNVLFKQCSKMSMFKKMHLKNNTFYHNGVGEWKLHLINKNKNTLLVQSCR